MADKNRKRDKIFMDLKQLQYFVVCAQTGSFSDAAKNLYSTQPSVSKVITATRSFTVVISGPDATAGSILIFLKNNGIQVPTALEINIANNSATPIHPDTA